LTARYTARREAKATGGHRLKARYVIHTVGPVWAGGAKGEEALLASCYRNCMRLAQDLGVRSIAFPSVSTGVYGYPVALAAPAAVGTVLEALGDNAELTDVIFVCFDEKTLAAYRSALDAAGINDKS